MNNYGWSGGVRDVGGSPTHAPATKIASFLAPAIALVALFSYIVHFEKPLAPNDRHAASRVTRAGVSRPDATRRQAELRTKSAFWLKILRETSRNFQKIKKNKIKNKKRRKTFVFL